MIHNAWTFLVSSVWLIRMSPPNETTLQSYALRNNIISEPSYLDLKKLMGWVDGQLKYLDLH